MNQFTMPSRFYTDAAYFDVEKEQIFHKTWQYIGHVSSLPKPGDFLTVRIADENILVTRDEEGTLHGFYNVCRHRAHPVASGCGNRRLFVCPYHAWSYRLNGKLQAAPNSENVSGFCKTDIALTEVRLETLAGFIFVNLDKNAKSLNEAYPGVEEAVLKACPNLPEMELAFEDKFAHHCNWKVSLENFNECYHCAVVHKFLTTQLYAAETYRADISGNVVKHFLARIRDRETHGDLHCWYLWPNVAIELFPMHRSVSLRHFTADGPLSTTYAYAWFVDPTLSEAAKAEVNDLCRQYVETTANEDAEIVEAVQVGLNSRAYDTGPLMISEEITPSSEHAIAHFQMLYRDAIAPGLKAAE